jgi:serine/threonine protein kinase
MVMYSWLSILKQRHSKRSTFKSNALASFLASFERYALKLYRLADPFIYVEPREIEVLKKLDRHEHVIHYYDHFSYKIDFSHSEKILTGLVMEYCAVIYTFFLF